MSLLLRSCYRYATRLPRCAKHYRLDGPTKLPFAPRTTCKSHDTHKINPFGISHSMMFYSSNDSENTSSIQTDLKKEELCDQVALDRIKTTYKYVGGGLAITGAMSFLLYKACLPYEMAKLGAWGCFGIHLATTLPFLAGTILTDFESKPQLKHALWTGFAVSMAGSTSWLWLFGSPLLAQAALGTGCVVGGLSAWAISSHSISFNPYIGALYTGLGIVVGAGVGNMIWLMPILHTLSIYGGLAVFSGLLVWDTQTLVKKAKTSDKYDPINESLNVYLDTLNIFIRIAETLLGNRTP